MNLIGNSWDNILEEEYQKDYFKKIVLYINEAYKVLSDDTARKKYDRMWNSRIGYKKNF